MHIETNMALFYHKWVSTTLSQSMGFSLIPLDISRTIRLVKPLVSGSTKFLSDFSYSKKMTLSFSICFTALCPMRMCHFFLLYTLLYATSIATWESQWREIVVGCLPHNGISARKIFSHSVSWPANSRVMNSTSRVERVIQVYLVDFHKIAPSPKVNT